MNNPSVSASGLPTQDERIMAALSHITVLVPTVGVLAPIVIWVIQKDRSRFVASQALQAAAFQLSILVLWMGGMACYMLSFFGMFGLGTLTDQYRRGPGPMMMILPFAIIMIMLLLMALMVITGIVAAVMALQGKDFHYPLIGGLVERALQRGTAPSPEGPTL